MQTVSKTTGPQGEAVPQPAATERKTVTDWRVLTGTRLIPVRVKCEGYLSQHPSDIPCHTNILATSRDLIRHFHGGRGQQEGWFKMRFRLSDKEGSPLWLQLEEVGVELHQLFCPHCRSEVSMESGDLFRHLQPHPGAQRVILEPQTLCMTLGLGMPKLDDLSDLY